MLIGFFLVLNAVQMVMFALDFLTIAPIYGILYAAAVLPIVVGAYFFI